MIASIDIGTSYSSISMLGPDGKILPVDISTGVSMFGSKYSLPSAVFVEDDGELLLGQAAINSRMRKPQNYRDEFKRNLGESVPILMGNRSFLPEDLYTEFFQHMKACAEKVSGEKIEVAYLTCPASYGRSQKDKIRFAANAAGLFDLELVDEPTAAAMSYCAEGLVQDKQNLLIYDFGGGTFDVSLIRYENGEFHPLTAALGLERCGGIDIDRLIFRDMMSKVDPATLGMLQANNLHYMRFMTQLSELAVKCKHHMSSADQFSEDIVVGFDYIPYSLTIERYNQMIAGLVGQTIHTCRQIMENAKLKISDLNAVLLVGGTSRVRLVREMVEQMADKVPVRCAADLELAVSQGPLSFGKYISPIDEIDADGWYLKGIQYEKEDNSQKAVSCYHKAAEMGSMYGQYSLALCYQSAYGVEESDEQAVFWYIKAAEQGHADSQYALGICYLSGLGVQKNVVEARRWLEKASEQDHLEAIFELDKMDRDSRKPLENNKKKEKLDAPQKRDLNEYADLLNRVFFEYGTGLTLIKQDGSVWNSRDHFAMWKNMKCVSGMDDVFGLREDGSVVANINIDVSRWRNIRMLAAGQHIVGLREDDTVVATGENDNGQCNVSQWNNIRMIAAGDFHTVGLREDGTVAAIGDAQYGALDVKDWKDIIAIKACGDNTIGIRKDGKVLYTRYEHVYETRGGLFGFGAKKELVTKRLPYAITPVSLF